MNRTAEQLGFPLNELKGPVCPYCGSYSYLKDSSVIYSTSYGMLWICSSYPKCDSYVGTHSNGPYKNYPLGRLANKELRNAKKAAHAAFDQLWKSGHFTRSSAYTWLRIKTGLSEPDGHIGEMEVEMCNMVQRLAEECLARNTITVPDTPIEKLAF